MKMPINFTIITTGLAIFSMFFGAGNVIYPLSLGQYAQDFNDIAILGFLITAVGVPFAGVIAMTLFDGDYKQFFARIGRWPAFFVTAIIMGLIGPFGALPRCIALSFSTTSSYLPDVSLPLFSAISCLLIFLFTMRRSSVVEILGSVLTPFLLGALAVIIIKGLWVSPAAQAVDHQHMTVFWEGIKQGYQTMDLLGSFFFSSVVLVCLKKELPEKEGPQQSLLFSLALKASLVGAFLLSLTYIGFSYVAAFHSEQLSAAHADELIRQIAVTVLGAHAGIIVCLAVALACLTTAIALCAVFAEYIHEEISGGKMSYGVALVITLLIAFAISTLNFTAIIALLAPILEICYPALITLTLLNILYKLYRFKPVQIPVFTVFALSLVYHFAG